MSFSFSMAEGEKANNVVVLEPIVGNNKVVKGKHISDQ